MNLILHKTDLSPPARAVMMVAEILGLEMSYKEVNVANMDQYQPEYLKKNPLHTVPVLEDGDLILADSHAIITYLVSKYGGAQEELYPSAFERRAVVDQRLHFDGSVLFPRLRTIIYSIKRKLQSGVTKQQLDDIEEVYRVVEKYLENSKFLAGDSLTVADVSCVATISSLHYIHEIDSKYEKLHNWWNRLKQYDWYESKNAPGLNAFEFFMKGLLEK